MKGTDNLVRSLGQTPSDSLAAPNQAAVKLDAEKGENQVVVSFFPNRLWTLTAKEVGQGVVDEDVLITPRRKGSRSTCRKCFGWSGRKRRGSGALEATSS